MKGRVSLPVALEDILAAVLQQIEMQQKKENSDKSAKDARAASDSDCVLELSVVSLRVQQQLVLSTGTISVV